MTKATPIKTFVDKMPHKPSYYFMVGSESLDISNVKLVHSPVGSGLVSNYESKQEAYKAAQAMCDAILGVTYA